MRVEQAVYTSAETSRARGYHLIARSPGIDERLGRNLATWSPSHDSLLGSTDNSASLNFIPLETGQLAIGRTFFGGPEYSRRGGLRVVTNWLVMDAERLAGYDNNPVALARMAMALGFLRLLPSYPEKLPLIDIPDSILGSTEQSVRCVPDSMLQESLQLLSRDVRVAVIYRGQALDAVEAVILRLSREKRLSLSFSSGLRPSLQRCFRLHILPLSDSKARRKLSQHRIQCVDGSR